MLGDLGIDDYRPKKESVAILVGPNGSGKSSFLRDLANHYRFNREVIVVCNTPHDRFLGIRHIDRISVGRPGQSAKSIVKDAVAKTIDVPDSRFYQIASILDYCGYKSKFGFTIDPAPRRRRSSDAGGDGAKTAYAYDQDFRRAVEFLERRHPDDPIWIDDLRAHWDYDTGGRLLYLADASYGAISDDNSRAAALRSAQEIVRLAEPLGVRVALAVAAIVLVQGAGGGVAGWCSSST